MKTKLILRNLDANNGVSLVSGKVTAWYIYLVEARQGDKLQLVEETFTQDNRSRQTISSRIIRTWTYGQ